MRCLGKQGHSPEWGNPSPSSYLGNTWSQGLSIRSPFPHETCFPHGPYHTLSGPGEAVCEAEVCDYLISSSLLLPLLCSPPIGLDAASCRFTLDLGAKEFCLCYHVPENGRLLGWIKQPALIPSYSTPRVWAMCRENRQLSWPVYLYWLVWDHKISLPRGVGTSQFLSRLILISFPLSSAHCQITWTWIQGQEWVWGVGIVVAGEGGCGSRFQLRVWQHWVHHSEVSHWRRRCVMCYRRGAGWWRRGHADLLMHTRG